MESRTYIFPGYLHTVQAHSQDLQNRRLHGCSVCMYTFIAMQE